MREKLLKWLIVGGLLVWLLWGVDWERLGESLLQLNPLGVVATLATVVLGDLLVAYRWFFLSGSRISFSTSLDATMVAFFLNIFAPAKLGDLSKIYYIHRREGSDPHWLTALFLVERSLDMVVLAIMVGVSALFILPSRIALLSALLLLAGVGILLYGLLHRRVLVRWILLLPKGRVRRLAYRVVRELGNLSMARLLGALGATLLVWGGYYLNNLLFFLWATDFHLTIPQILAASTLAFAVSAIPITPGGVGTFQAAFVVALGWYGIGKEEALASSGVLQLLYLLPATLYTLYLSLKREFLWSPPRDLPAREL
ncbi:MAG: flippase-like domain-containing protein [Epsilonproteobacteria bacterium]|nr:hypothetical protein [Campylobacterota bacterium]NPA57605.1 flippase-like domain-containing protein [Campylobacterota bacterium]